MIRNTDSRKENRNAIEGYQDFSSQLGGVLIFFTSKYNVNEGE
jgi:hypothetical protein